MRMDEENVTLLDLPTSVRGFCYHDNDGNQYIVLNARLTREANQKTYDHERQHILRGDMYDPNYQEYREGT